MIFYTTNRTIFINFYVLTIKDIQELQNKKLKKKGKV